MSREGLDKKLCRRMTRRYRELAAMLKKKKSGTLATLDRIKARFALQEGLRFSRVTEYMEILQSAGLIVFTSGHKRWKYYPDAEWELFNVSI